MTFLERVKAELSADELIAVASLFAVPADLFDDTTTKLEKQTRLISLHCTSVHEACCPFTLHFHREHRARLSFFIGRGAEFYNYEALDGPSDLATTARDVQGFLSSTVRCERYAVRGRLAKEVYAPSAITIDGSPIRLPFQILTIWPWSRPNVEITEYRPWLAGSNKNVS